MKSIPTIILTALVLMLVASCKKAGSIGYVELSTLSKILKTFDGTSQDRSTSHHSTTIMFEDLSYYVSTQEPEKTEGGRRGVLTGPSRESGYFVEPRMEWAETIEEVEEIIRADYKRGIGIPTSSLDD